MALAEAGADVVISARSADQLAKVAAQVEAAGRRALVIPADLSDLDVAAGPVAAAVVFLASPASGYITGKVLEVDGGIERPNLDLGIPDL